MGDFQGGFHLRLEIAEPLHLARLDRHDRQGPIFAAVELAQRAERHVEPFHLLDEVVVVDEHVPELLPNAHDREAARPDAHALSHRILGPEKAQLEPVAQHADAREGPHVRLVEEAARFHLTAADVSIGRGGARDARLALLASARDDLLIEIDRRHRRHEAPALEKDLGILRLQPLRAGEQRRIGEIPGLPVHDQDHPVVSDVGEARPQGLHHSLEQAGHDRDGEGAQDDPEQGQTGAHLVVPDLPQHRADGLPYVHSYLSASTGFSLEALMAG
jgi:hypothetical protein